MGASKCGNYVNFDKLLSQLFLCIKKSLKYSIQTFLSD